jgi:hypothetical protein
MRRPVTVIQATERKSINTISKCWLVAWLVGDHLLLRDFWASCDNFYECVCCLDDSCSIPRTNRDFSRSSSLFLLTDIVWLITTRVTSAVSHGAFRKPTKDQVIRNNRNECKCIHGEVERRLNSEMLAALQFVIFSFRQETQRSKWANIKL